MDKLTVFTGNANPELAQDVCDSLNVPLGESTVDRFRDGETRGERVRVLLREWRWESRECKLLRRM